MLGEHRPEVFGPRRAEIDFAFTRQQQVAEEEGDHGERAGHGDDQGKQVGATTDHNGDG